jgi:hypothetical protein
MKRFALAFLLALSAAGPALAQPAPDSSEGIASADAREAFEKLKSLAGTYVGQLRMDNPGDEMDGRLGQFTLRVTSRGNALVHELSLSGIPDHPVTIFYLEGDRLVATHYCDAGNRPRLVGTLSPDGKKIEFEFLDLSGGDEYGHMHRIAFTLGDENNHTEEWTFKMPSGEFHGRFELQRTNADSGPAAY